MLTWLNSQSVRSSRGFEVSSIDRFTIEYREGNRLIGVNVENGFVQGKPAVLIQASAFEKWDNDSTTITDDRQAEMQANFIEAMEFQGISVVVS